MVYHDVMDLEDVRIFTTVVDRESFTKAAAVLDMPKSTVSRRVSALEDTLGVRLLHRTTRSLRLTPAGQLYYSRTRRLIDDLKSAEEAVQEMQAGPGGLLRLTIPNDITGMMAQLITAFQREYPQVRLSVFSTGRRVDLVAEGYDLALRAGTLTDSSLVSRKLLSQRFYLVASPAYLREHAAPQSPNDLSEHDCLIFGTERTEALWTLKREEEQVEVRVKGRLACNDFDLLRHAALSGVGLTYLPEWLVVEHLRQGELIALLPEYAPDLGGGLYAVYPSPKHLTPRVRAFIDFAADWLTQSCRRAATPG